MIKYDNLTNKGKELYNKLKKIWDNEEFIIGILSYAKQEDDRQKVIEFIDNHPKANDEIITLFALRENRHLPHPEYE